VAATTQVREIRIQIDTKGDQNLKALASQMGLLNKNVNSLSSSFSFLRGITGISILGFGIKEIADIADSMQNLTNRLGLFSESSDAARRKLGDILKVANDTATSIDSLATIYVRLASTTKQANISSDTLLTVTKALQQSFRLSGATTAEATNTAIQLSQGLASGQLRGQELRSVLEQNVVAGDLLTKSLGKTRGELYKLAEQGRITSGDVLLAFLKNAKDLDKQAEGLSATFEQSLTKSFNNLKVAIGDINKEFNVSGAFAKGLDLITAKFTLLAAAIGAVALTALPALYASLGTLVATVSKAALALSPLTVFLAGVGVAALLVFDNLQQLVDFFKPLTNLIVGEFLRWKAVFADLGKEMLKTLDIGQDYQQSLETSAYLARAEANSIDGVLLSYREMNDERRKTERLLTVAEGNKKKAQTDELDRLAKLAAAQEKERKKLDFLKDLNALYFQSKISTEEYYIQLDKVNRKENERVFLSGAKDLAQYNEQREKLNKSDLNRSLSRATISIAQFNEEINKGELKKLNDQLDAGKISLLEYDAAFVKLSDDFSNSSVLRTGANDYLKSIGTVAEGIAGAIQTTFKGLEDGFVQFIQRGSQDWKDFAQLVLDDLTRIIVRSLIIQPLAKGLLNFNYGSGGDAGASRGNRFSGYITNEFAMGGVVSGATPFTYGGGKLGVMGESGPEAILPLSKASDGSLGVSATPSNVIVNITNQTGGEVSQSESTGPSGERVIDVLITNKVKGAIASGQLDKTFQSAYGLRRKGS
jgi:lambda family phage tail tape measure protein